MNTSRRAAKAMLHAALIGLLLSGCSGMADHGANYGASGTGAAGMSGAGGRVDSINGAAMTGSSRTSDLLGRQDSGDGAFDVSNDAQLRRAAEQGRLPK